jgi:hypothetical protein
MVRAYRRIVTEPYHPGSHEAPAVQLCDHAGCGAEGPYRAPKSRDRLNDYYWFCLEHVRDYNRAWDFYAGMKPDEIEAHVRRDVTWDRPTWRLGSWNTDPRILGAEFIPGDIDPFGTRRAAEAGRPKSKRDQALAELALAPNATTLEIKKRYKTLAKQLHPDANGGDKAAEERLKVINLAYSTLKNCAAV